MPSLESLYQSIGGTAFPLDAADFTDTLVPLDPARGVLAALFKSAINSELGEAWTKATANTPLAGTLPVADVLELEPNAAPMLQRKPAFPLLCIYRAGSPKFEQLTLHEDRVTQDWEIHYILGALDIAGQRKLGDVFLAIAKILRLVIRQRGHKSYEDGALQFFPGKGSLSSVELTGMEGPGPAKFANDETTYYAATYRLETTEVSADDLDAFGPIEAATFEIDAGDDQGLFPSLIIADTSAPPSINVYSPQPVNDLPLVFGSSVMQLELRADRAVTLKDGDVRAWGDQSGFGRDYVQENGAQRPTYSGQTINGRQAIDFDGADDALVQSGGPAITQTTHTLFVVIDADSLAAVHHLLDYQTGRAVFAHSGNPPGSVGAYDGTWHLPGAAVNGVQLLTFQWNGAASSIRYNGAQVGSVFTLAAMTLGTVSAIGAQFDGGLSFFDGRIGHIALYSPALSATDIESAESLLKQIWGI